MSTCAIIAAPDPNTGWAGVYHHWDGYPTGLGVYLQRILEELHYDVGEFRRLLIDAHPAGYSSILYGLHISM